MRFLDGQPGRSVALTFDELGDPPYLVASLRPNANALFDIPSVDGYDGGVQVTDRWAEAMSSMANVPFDPELTLRAQIAIPVDTALLGRYGVRWVVIDTRAGDPASIVPGFHGPVATDGTLAVFENPAWRGEAVAWFATQPATDGDEVSSPLGNGRRGAERRPHHRRQPGADVHRRRATRRAWPCGDPGRSAPPSPSTCPVTPS